MANNGKQPTMDNSTTDNRDGRDRRLVAMVTDAEAGLIMAAAARDRRSISAFIASAALDRARELADAS